jgi:hypothetical protein
VVNGNASYCLSIGGVQIDHAVVRAVLAALEPLGLEAELAAAKKLSNVSRQHCASPPRGRR